MYEETIWNVGEDCLSVDIYIQHLFLAYEDKLTIGDHVFKGSKYNFLRGDDKNEFLKSGKLPYALTKVNEFNM